jgi:release factor glutamine methyltransferase
VAHAALELSRQAAAVLEERGFDHPRLEAELLLASVLGLKRLDLYLQFDRPIDEAELERFRAVVRRRLRREPLQYILGEVAFREIVLRVDRRALIPRPETEILVGEVLAWAATRRVGSAMDIGTGTGAIALSLAYESGLSRIVASDVSAEALALARENATRLGLDHRIEFRTGPMWSVVAAGERFDIIVSNPPYVAESERGTLAPEVVEWEPATALFGGADGLAVLDELIEGAADRLGEGGLLAMELGAGQASAVAARIRQTGRFEEPRTVKDLAGHDRIMLAVRQ